MLCRLRIRLAHNRNKGHLIHLHTKDPKYNYHKVKQSQTEEMLCSLFPPRKKWKNPGESKRSKNGASRNTSEKNMLSLLMTIKFYERQHPLDLSLAKLNEFIIDIQQSIHQTHYKISGPNIIPKPKEDKLSQTEINICRPIASFGLKDKIILSITNRYLTNVLDHIFIDESYAFRAKRLIKGIPTCPTHHDPVEQILDYRKKFQEEKLWVSECDMKKFFDTVNHTIIKNVMGKLLTHKSLSQCLPSELYNAKRILYDYLDSYTFNRTVLPLNKDKKYFKKYNIEKGEFGWVKEELLSAGYYKRISTAKIGIPQGGALSGLIANAVLHDIDRNVMHHQDGSLLYVRFCDDMLLIHPEKEKCKAAFSAYLNGLKSKKLMPHAPVYSPFNTAKSFWSEKSKECYQWTDDEKQGSPWIGFVGYEIHYQGAIRVRKSSLLKEMKKQYKVVGDLKVILNNPQCRSSKNTIYESVANRLIGMSVGRVDLWNYKSIKPEMCWTSGYKLLTDNKYSRIQLRRLDTSRNRLLSKLKNKIDKIVEPQKSEDDQEIGKPNEQLYYGNPFSYYYQVLKVESK